jgi:hypothetical protein
MRRMKREAIYFQLYEELLVELGRVRASGLSAGEELEGCFRIAFQFGESLAACSLATDPSTPLRIAFYKGVKPKFWAELRYCEWCYHALLFKPASSISEWKVFWIRETNRSRKYIEENEDLYRYYMEDRTDRDEEFFGGDPIDADRYAQVIGECLALERYAEYIDQSFNQFMQG